MAEGREDNPRDVAEWVRQMPIRAPRDIRGVFHALAQYRRDDGLDRLLARIDFDGIGPAAIYEAVLRRPPENRKRVTPPPDFDAREAFKAALLSQEFRVNALLPSWARSPNSAATCSSTCRNARAPT
jgi:hypothetical protein